MLTWRSISSTDSEFQLAQNIRQKVFVDEQGVNPIDENDSFEISSIHYIVFDGDDCVATARSRETRHGLKLERFAVLSSYRGKGVGRFLVKKVLKQLISLNKPIYLHAQIQVVGFYKKLGFYNDGDMFLEAGIKHYKMFFKPVLSN